MKPTELPYLVLLGLAAGVAIATQSGVNAHLRTWLNTPIQAAFLSFAVGTVFLGTLTILDRRPWPAAAALRGVPLWGWTGGLLGAFTISSAVILAPRLGALALAVLVVCGQVFASMAFDHFGLLGYARYPLTPSRFAGGVLLVVGVVLVARR